MHGDPVTAPSSNRDHSVVLLVEDDEQARGYLAAALRTGGFIVEETGSAERGLMAVHRMRPRAIITDVALAHGMDGISFARRVRQDPAISHVPLIAVTGCALDVTYGGADAFDAVLVKPVDGDELVAHVRRSIMSGHLHNRSRRAVNQGRELVARSVHLLEHSRRLFARGDRARPCPRCGVELHWTERRDVGGFSYDFYRSCINGCGVYCYNLTGSRFVGL